MLPDAEASDNVFYYVTYEGSVDLNGARDEVELKALETQINEFGQVGWVERGFVQTGGDDWQ